MRFYCILHKNSIDHLLKTSRDYYRPPPPQSFRKEIDNNITFYVHFRRVFIDVIHITKIWPKNTDLKLKINNNFSECTN